MLADTAELAVRLKLDNAAYERGIKSATRATDAFGKTVGKIGGHVSQGVGKAVQNLERLAVVAGGFAIGGAAAAVKWAGDFEAQLNTINTIAFATPAALTKIGDGIRTIAKTTGLSLDDLTQSYYDLLSAGVKAKDAQSLLNNAVTLGIGGLATTQQTVDLLTTAYNAYGLTAAGAAKATDQFAQAVADGKVTAAQIAESFSNIASIAKTAGVGIDQIAASFAFLTAQGVPAAEVTTEMQRAIVSLMKPLPALETAQKKLKIVFTEEIRKKGLVPALQELREYSDKNKVPLLELLGRIEAVKYVLQTTGPNFAGFNKELGNIGDSAGMAAKQMAERQQGLNFQLARLGANVKDAGITIGTALIPELVELSATATKFFTDHQADVKAFGQNLAKGFKDAVTWAKSLDWAAIGGALKTAAGAAKGIIDAFMGAPLWLKEAVITGWGLNKLTGGALTNIGGDIAKGIGSQFLGRGSSPANPLWVQSVGGVGAGTAAGGAVSAVTTAAALIGFDIALQSIAHNPVMGQTVANSFGVKTQGQTNFGAGPGGSDLQRIIMAQRIANGTTGGSTGMGPAGNGAASRGGFISHAVQANITALRANTIALKANARDIEKAWLKTIDPEDIAARSKAKTGRDATPAQISATRTRDELHQLKVITEKSKASSDTKLERLRVLAADAKAHGDTKTATKIQTAIAKMKADIKAAQSKTTSAVDAASGAIVGAIAGSKPNVNVFVTTNVTANSVTRATTSVARYGNTGGDRRYDP